MTHRFRTVTACAALLGLSACSSSPVARPTTPTPHPSAVVTASPETVTPSPAPPVFLLPGEAAALPDVPPGVPFYGHLLIAENSSQNRILEVDPSGNVTWTFSTTSPPLQHPLGPPDDTFYTANGSAILMSSENGQGVVAIARTTSAVLWQLGSYYRRGDTANLFSNPDDAVPAADGTLWLADIRNCRVLHLNGTTGAVLSVLGGQGCRHNPPQQFSEPNGAFPTGDGSLIVTEISGDWVTWINPDGTVRWTHHVPTVYPSDAMGYPDGSVLLTDYTSPGAVLHIAADGTVLWRYSPRGAGQLNHPSIAIPIAGNRIAIVDDFNNRIEIVDPTTSAVVWQWSGSGAYHLIHPDGIDYRPS
jgi:sugar lactone lactonase YvrE